MISCHSLQAHAHALATEPLPLPPSTGDTFYTITSGAAAVVRETDTEPEQEIAQLVEGATFGERALLKKEPRFASVKATSPLKTMCISREAFERALGANLHDLIEDKYA